MSIKGILSLAGVFSVALCVGSTPAAADVFVVSPGAQASTEGDNDNGFPFNLHATGLNSQRYQQVYGASDFGAISGPMAITKLFFRPDAPSGVAFSSTLSDVQIDLSTTLKTPDTLSTTFADNEGSDDTVVFSGSLSLSSAFTGPLSGPKTFDIEIDLASPFLYNPAAGDLLLDVRNFGGGTTTQFDAEFLGGDSSSRVFSVSNNGVGDASGIADTFGLVTEFDFVQGAAPEPTSLLLVATVAGAVMIGLKRRWRYSPISGPHGSL